ncbi:hypothetical protein ES703_18707 [subsurface metagenome]
MYFIENGYHYSKSILKKQNRKEMKNMPRGDGTGPGGLGPMTGRAAGYCAGYPMPGFMNPYGGRPGLGFGYGRGFGRGFRRAFGPAYSYPVTPPPTAYGGGFYQPPVEPKQEMEMLAEEAKALKEQLEAINKRVSELKETKEK